MGPLDAREHPPALRVDRREQSRGSVADRADDLPRRVRRDQQPAEARIPVEVDHRAVAAGEHDGDVVVEVDLVQLQQRAKLPQGVLDVVRALRSVGWRCASVNFSCGAASSSAQSPAGWAESSVRYRTSAADTTIRISLICRLLCGRVRRKAQAGKSLADAVCAAASRFACRAWTLAEA